MSIIIRTFQDYRTAISHFISIAEREIFLDIFLLISFVSQIIYGLNYFDNLFIAIGYAIGTFLFISIAYVLTYYNTDNRSDNFEIRKSIFN